MGERFVSQRNLKFLLYDVFETTSLTQYDYFSHHSKENFDLIIETALRIGETLLKPCFRDLDRNPPEFVDRIVRVHPIVKTLMKEFGQGGWISAGAQIDLGGQQIPQIITAAFQYIFYAANYSACAYPWLTRGAAHLIESFGTEELIQTYIPKMFAGEWQGTMALTEPQAGSSVGDIQTWAEGTNEGYYKIHGQKIFISAGDHDAVENVIHLLLARIKGAASGVKGISLFLVPKNRSNERGELVPNDVNVIGIYHKLGYRGAPITHLSLGENDDCRGYLIGEPHKGLSYMFQMMNEARIRVGSSAAAIASAAYYSALEYAMQRMQGRVLGAKDVTCPQVPIIEHPDVKRMLLFQRSISEGSLSLILQCAKYVDLVRVLKEEERDRYSLLLDLLTPVAKSYPSEMGILSVSQGLQCLGGYGYCDEFPLEQHYRDARIHPIHEGTTGIHGQTLLGRNVIMKDGRALSAFYQEVSKVIKQAEGIAELKPYAEQLKDAIENLKDVTIHLINLRAKRGQEIFLADATLYLELFGIIAVSWQWLLQSIFIQKGLLDKGRPELEDFLQGKIFAFKYFFHFELPKIQGLIRRLTDNFPLTVEMKVNYFND
jgi:alkylation response protein AidB-like acyl-CoA dehydrogenase